MNIGPFEVTDDQTGLRLRFVREWKAPLPGLKPVQTMNVWLRPELAVIAVEQFGAEYVPAVHVDSEAE